MVNLALDKQSDEYLALIEECQAIITEGVWNFRLEKILTYGRLGERITKDSFCKKFQRGNLKFLETVAEDIGISYSELCRAVQFYEKFEIVSPTCEGWSKFKEGKNISWSKIKILYLPDRKQEECKHSFKRIEMWECRKCRKIVKEKPDEE